jgi:carbamate kinase
MGGTVVVLINGEVLANGHGSTIRDQRLNARNLADDLLPLFSSPARIVILHGNKPQVGFVLFRSEVASHAIHTVPLDICGADTQGATGYMLSQAFKNVISNHKLTRRVITVVTQTLVDTSIPPGLVPIKTIGPWFDREKAELYRQARGWIMMEEPGRGYRRGVPSYPAREILEIEDIRHLVEVGDIVIAGGGGGIPVAYNAKGELDGIEAVVETEQITCLMARQLQAQVVMMVVENDQKFILSGLSTETLHQISLEKLDNILRNETITSRSVLAKLQAASDFLHHGGEQVIITTLRKLPETLAKRSGLHIGERSSTVRLFNLNETP